MLSLFSKDDGSSDGDPWSRVNPVLVPDRALGGGGILHQRIEQRSKHDINIEYDDIM